MEGAFVNNNSSFNITQTVLNWDPSSLEIKTRTVEKALEPLVLQVTTLVASKSPQKKKGKSKRAHVLVAAVERATANFVERGQQIVAENPEIQHDMMEAVQAVQATGEAMGSAAREFAADPCSSVKRGNMKMAKGKHAPTKGAVREDKVIHPKSRKAAKMHFKEQRRLKLSGKVGIGGQRLQILGEKLLWFHDNLNVVLDAENEEKNCVTSQDMLELVEAYIIRNQDELEQIKLKNSIGSGQFRKRNQHQSRLDAIEMTHKTENEEFNGCGLEVPDLFDIEDLKKFQDWNSELRFVQNFKLKRVTRKSLESSESEEMITV